MLPPGLAYVGVSAKAWAKIDATPARISFRLARWALMSVLAGVNGVSLSPMLFSYLARSK